MDDRYRNAIGTVESSNNYEALGPQTRTGDRAYGRYQVMGANVPEWTERHLGQRMTPQEFLANKDAQDRVFDAETGAQFKKYGNLDDVTSTWFSGRPVSRAGNSSDGYNTVPQYLSKVNKAYGIQDQDGPTAIDTAMGRNSPRSTPMMSYAGDETRPALSAPQQPGALLNGGSPVAEKSWLEQMAANVRNNFGADNIGQTLKNMAPGIAQDPEHARVLEASAASTRKEAKQGSWSQVTLPNGQTGRVWSGDGILRDTAGNPMAGNFAKPEKDPVKQAYEIGQVTAGRELAADYAKKGMESRAAIETMAPVIEALKNPHVYQGTGGQLAYEKDKALLATPGWLGGDTPERRKSVEDAGTALAGINKLVQESRTLNGGLPGSLSEKDLQFLKDANASLSNSPETNQRILGIYKQLHERRIEQDNAARAYINHPDNKLGLDSKFQQSINDKWSRENAERDKALAAKEKPTSAPTTSAPLPKGVKSIQLIQ